MKIKNTLELIANRYINANPKNDYTARPFVSGEIVRNKDYRYTADFTQIFADTPNGSYVYTWGKYKAADDITLKFMLIPFGPVKIWLNRAEIYGTDVVAERYDNTPVYINLPVKKGWNDLVLRFTCTKAGFGGEFGTWLGKLDYYFFRGIDRFDEILIEGFDYTAPLAETLKDISPENLAPLCVPLRTWQEEELKQGVFGRIFRGLSKNIKPRSTRSIINEVAAGDRAVARTQVIVPDSVSCRFSGTQSGNCSFYIEKKLAASFLDAGQYQFEYELAAGSNDVLVVCECPDKEPWDFTMEVISDTSLHLTNPFFSGSEFPWVFAGPFKKTSDQPLIETFDRELLLGEEKERTWWRLDMPDTWVRLYNENPLYGHWNYPLGVTLYGLIETARLFQKNGKDFGSEISSYVHSHIEKSVRTLDYALFDKEHFGGATAVHHLLTSIDSLDDCGSFGSLVLEAAKDWDKPPQGFGVTVEYTADHILNKQDRLPENCFYRRDLMHHFHNDTLWADDLYMSVPFLCRYAKYKNDPSILDVAAIQFEGFKKYLFMENKNLMAHVYDLKRDMNTGVPWGRGNGWTIFSLTELLMILPKDHSRREFLLDFFRRLSSGYIACQDENGIWHQVLDMPSSYIETSCTAMFICAFCRGIRHDWFDRDITPYKIAAEKAWQALETYSIDKDGNIHGVCRGSEFSFNPKYYAEHLLPRLNDTHGIGIVLLAGVELQKLQQQG